MQIWGPRLYSPSV